MATVDELQQRIAAAKRYIANMRARGEDRFVQGATKKLQEYESQLAPLLSGSQVDPGFGRDPGVNPDPKMAITGEEMLDKLGTELPPGVDPNNVDPGFGRDPRIDFQPEPESGGTQIQTMPEAAPPATGNVAVDQANVLSSILNSPMYTESIKSAYLTQYLPGLTQANVEINAARAAEVKNALLREQAQRDAIREIAGNYAARGMRTPEMVRRGFAPVEAETDRARRAAEEYENQLIANKELMYGAGTQDAETFVTDPTMFGAVGAGARRTALSELQSLPQYYGLTQVEQASTSPLPAQEPEPVAQPPQAVESTQPTQPTMGREQLQAKIEAANRYIKNMRARGEDRFVQGATKKLQGYESQLASLGGF